MPLRRGTGRRVAYTRAGSATAAVFDPATLSLTGWWRGSYAGSPWSGSASAGGSATPTLSDAISPGRAPAVGATVNGYAPADFVPNDILEASVNTSSLWSASAGGIAVLFNADTTAAAQAEAYDDRPLATDLNGRFALVHTSSGIRATIYNGAAWVKTPSIAVGTGAWHWAFAWWDGTTLYVQLDGGSPQSIAIGGTVALGTAPLRLGENYASAASFDGGMLDIMAISATWSAGNMTNIVGYGNSRYGLAL